MKDNFIVKKSFDKNNQNAEVQNAKIVPTDPNVNNVSNETLHHGHIANGSDNLGGNNLEQGIVPKPVPKHELASNVPSATAETLNQDLNSSDLISFENHVTGHMPISGSPLNPKPKSRASFRFPP